MLRFIEHLAVTVLMLATVAVGADRSACPQPKADSEAIGPLHNGTCRLTAHLAAHPMRFAFGPASVHFGEW